MISATDQQGIATRIEKLNPDSKALWGKMTVAQMLAHMNDAFRIALGMKAAVDKSNFFWNKIAFPVAVYVLPGFPKNSPTAGELNQLQQGTPARDFYTEAGFAVKMMEVFNERDESKLKPHPMFGKLSKQQWSDLLVKHFDHHLKQFGV